MTMMEKGRSPITEKDRKTLILYGLLCPPFPRVTAFEILGSLDEPSLLESSRRLESSGLIEGDRLTVRGWETLRKMIDSKTLEKASGVWRERFSDLTNERDREATKWAALRRYVDEPFKEPEPTDITLDAPLDVATMCRDYMKHARLCACVGAWAGAIAYCSLALEHLLLSVLVARNVRKGFTDVPALQELNGEVGKHIPEVSTLTQRIVPLIANFRNDSVHPRDHRLRPSENQARNVYDLVVRFMADVKMTWFQP
jgi:hypothetical protein